MYWRKYFTAGILDRAKAYHKRGLVRDVEEINGRYTARVLGSMPYDVSVWKKANGQLGMSCTCPYAADGKRCKHMAALCMSIDKQLSNNELVAIAAQKKPDEQVYPFVQKNVPGSKEYTYFDLSVMTQGWTIMKSQLMEAKKLI